VSSTYRTICLSHDPALTFDPELTHEEANQLNSRDNLGDHTACDIVIGRWSGGLVEIGCPGLDIPGAPWPHRHGNIEWVDVGWLRLLHAARPHVETSLLSHHTFRCWKPERLHRLRIDLGLPEQPAVDEAAEARAVIAGVGRTKLHVAIRALARLDPEWWRNEIKRMARIEGCTSFLGERK
jgi:hypothetical protein